MGGAGVRWAHRPTPQLMDQRPPRVAAGGRTGDARFEREAWEALRGHVRGAVRLGMRRLIVAHSDEQGSAESQSRVVRVHARDGRRVLPEAGAPRLPYNSGLHWRSREITEI